MPKKAPLRVLTRCFAFVVVLFCATAAYAQPDCSFTTSGSTMTLDGDCVTDETIVVPDGVTLDGQGFAIMAVDPPSGHFVGGVVASGGDEAHVTNLTIVGMLTVNACDGGPDRLRGILFDGAGGSITRTTVRDINQGASGCQEGNAIEVRNAPFDGTHPDTRTVEIAHNRLTGWQKSGIVANGDVSAWIHNNEVGASATQEDLAANGVQLGFGARGTVVRNRIEGNQWKGTSFFAASAVLVFAADPGGVEVARNVIDGNSDVGIFVVSDGGVFDNNKVFDTGADHANSCCDIGIGNFGEDNPVTNNKVRGFEIPLAGPDDGDNKVIPSPNLDHGG